MDANALRLQYQSYIRCLNERRFTQLGDHVAKNPTYNGRQLTLEDYRTMLVSDTIAIPDLFFDVTLLIAENDHVAARIDFRCTPQGEFLGFRPNGSPVRFSKNVFYRFSGEKITDVWSLIDLHSIEEQLGTARRVSSFPAPVD